MLSIHSGSLPSSVLDEVVALSALVAASSPAKFYYAGDDAYFLRTVERGALFTFYQDRKMVAYATLVLPGLTEDNKLYYHGTPFSLNRLASAAEFQDCGVHPDYRGQRLQSRLIEARLDHCQYLGSSLAYAYFNPRNVVSQLNLARAGFNYLRMIEEPVIGISELRVKVLDLPEPFPNY